ncbi:hypothetical protein ACEPAH_6382 [Sanghuangporus vaninii]
MSTSQAQASQSQDIQAHQAVQQECLSCKVIGTAAFGAVGVYALRQSRVPVDHPGAPKGPVARRIMAGVGFCFLGLSFLRWTMNTSTLSGHAQRKETTS